MESDKISVIVPVYNSEQYLEKCIESILSQTYSNFELLLINDGSTDGSGELCRRYETDGRVKFYDRQNEGVSRTRNFGIKEATGKYLLFVDSDDYIESDMLMHLWKTATEHAADCSVCGIIYETEKGSRNFPKKRVIKITNGKEAVREVLINQIAMAGPVCKLFLKSALDEISFPEDLTVGEDALFVVCSFLRARKVVFDTKQEYHYNHREESLTSSPFSERDFDLIHAYDRIFECVKEADCHLEKESRFRMIWAHFHTLDKALLTGGRALEYKPVIHWLRKHTMEILKNPYVGKKRKLAMCLLFFSCFLYRRVIAP